MNISCPICTFINRDRVSCEACQAAFTRPCPTCTFQNHLDIAYCEMCDTALIVATPQLQSSESGTAKSLTDAIPQPICQSSGSCSSGASKPLVIHTNDQLAVGDSFVKIQSSEGPTHKELNLHGQVLDMKDDAPTQKCPYCSLEFEVEGQSEGIALVCRAGANIGCGQRFKIIGGTPRSCAL